MIKKGKSRAAAALSSLIVCLAVGEAHAHKPRVSVTAFENKANSGQCYRGAGDLGSGFAEQLITALSESDKIQIYEREKINQVYNQEHNLVNRSRTGGPRKNKFESADFTIAGAITEFSSCVQGNDTGVSVGGLLSRTVFKNTNVDMHHLDVGVGSEKSKVVADIRVINVETGEVLKSVKASGAKTKKNFKFDTSVYGAGFKTDQFKDTPLGEATRDAITEAVHKIVASLPDDVPDTAQANGPDESSGSDGDAPPPPRGRNPPRGGRLSDSASVDAPEDEGLALDKDVAEYKAVYCSDAF